MYVSIKTYIRCKHVFQNNHWDGIADYASASSHLKTIKSKCHEISHEGIPLDEFHSNFMMDPYYSWNPPIRTTLTAVGINDIDDCQINLDDNDNNVHTSIILSRQKILCKFGLAAMTATEWRRH